MNRLFLIIGTLILMLLTTLYKCENYESSSDIRYMKNNADKEDNETESRYNQTSNGTRITNVRGEIWNTASVNQLTEENSTTKLLLNGTLLENTQISLLSLKVAQQKLKSPKDTEAINESANDAKLGKESQKEAFLESPESIPSKDTQHILKSLKDSQRNLEILDNKQTLSESLEDMHSKSESLDDMQQDPETLGKAQTSMNSTVMQSMSVSLDAVELTTESINDTESTLILTDDSTSFSLNDTESTSITNEVTKPTSEPSTDTQTTTESSIDNQTTTEPSIENPTTTESSTDIQTTTEFSERTLPETDSPIVSQQTQSTTENPSVTKLATVTQSVVESQSPSIKSFSISTETPTTITTIIITTEGHTEITGNIPTSPKDSTNSSASEQSTPSTTANSKTSICEPNPCLFGGNCSEFSKEEYNCSCGEGLLGKNCEILDSCVSNGSGGFCKNGKCVYALNHRIRYCECFPGFYFDFLHKECLHGTDIGECIKQSPCPKTTDCLNTKEGYCCVCKRGYRLANYFSIPEKDGCIELCNPNPCVHGECNIIEGSTFNCSCETGYTGDFCEEEGKKTYVDACVKDNPCPDTTECLNIKGNYTCRCKAGFRLASSSSDASVDGCVEICNPNPCVHGICIKYGANMYQCSCEAGYSGALCDKENGELKQAKRTSVIVGTLLGIFLIITIIVFMETLRRLKKRKPDEETTELFYGTSEMILNRTTNFNKNQNLRKISKKHVRNSSSVEKYECEVREP